MATATLTATNEAVEEIRKELDAVLDDLCAELDPLHRAESEALRALEARYYAERATTVEFYQSLCKPAEAAYQGRIDAIRERLQEATGLAVLNGHGCGGDYREHDAALDKAEGWHSYTPPRDTAGSDFFGM